MAAILRDPEDGRAKRDRGRPHGRGPRLAIASLVVVTRVGLRPREGSWAFLAEQATAAGRWHGCVPSMATVRGPFPIFVVAFYANLGFGCDGNRQRLVVVAGVLLLHLKDWIAETVIKLCTSV